MFQAMGLGGWMFDGIDRFGKFPGTVPTIFILTYLKAHHLDLDFYYHHFKPGAYLESHALHMECWDRDRK